MLNLQNAIISIVWHAISILLLSKRSASFFSLIRSRVQLPPKALVSACFFGPTFMMIMTTMITTTITTTTIYTTSISTTTFTTTTITAM